MIKFYFVKKNVINVISDVCDAKNPDITDQSQQSAKQHPQRQARQAHKLLKPLTNNYCHFHHDDVLQRKLLGEVVAEPYCGC
uniref:Uncharacterized protein n=1 Tax=Panagrolaimus sp. JU765 TaxID=591449 RepID=A0AC34Q2J6_9BILA